MTGRGAISHDEERKKRANIFTGYIKAISFPTHNEDEIQGSVPM
jgi:hypothetical protein